MSQGHPFETDLRDMIARGQVVAVVGSGVSMATTSQAPLWRKLIQSGVEHCRSLDASAQWCQLVAGQLALDSEPDMLLAAAELVHNKLRQYTGELARWLRESFEPLPVGDPTVIERLAALKLPLVTTNCDDLLERITRKAPVTWNDPRNAAKDHLAGSLTWSGLSETGIASRRDATTCRRRRSPWGLGRSPSEFENHDVKTGKSSLEFTL